MTDEAVADDGTPDEATPDKAAPGEVVDQAAAEQAATEAARALHLRGLDARRRGDWVGAREAFAEAWARKRHWEIAVNLGEAEMKVGRYEEATAHLVFALEQPGFRDRTPELVEAERRTITGWLVEATTELEAARARARAKSAVSARDARGGPMDHVHGQPSPLWWLGLGAGATLAAAGALTGGILMGNAEGKIDGVRASSRTLPGKPGDPSSVRCQGAGEALCKANAEQLRAADTLQVAGGIALVSAGALAAATVVYAVLGPERWRQAPLVVPAAGPQALGFAVAGVW